MPNEDECSDCENRRKIHFQAGVANFRAQPPRLPAASMALSAARKSSREAKAVSKISGKAQL
jgi:hypothetical protein